MKLATPFLMLALPCFSAAQTVLVVDKDGGGDFTETLAASLAAPDGALLLVREGKYGSVVIDGKSLTIVAEAGEEVSLGSVTVHNLAADQHFTCVNIELDPPPATVGAMGFSNNQGNVWFENLVLPPTTFNPILSGPFVSITDCASLVFLSCSFASGFGMTLGQEPVTIGAFNSNLYLYNTSVEGGQRPFAGGDGAAAILFSGFLFSANSSIRGGDGLDGSCDGGDGGPGLGSPFLANANAALFGTGLGGGSAGAAGDPKCLPGQPGAPSSIQNGSVLQAPLSPRSFEIPQPLRAGTMGSASFQGPANETAWFLYGEDPFSLFLPSVSCSLLVAPPLFFEAAGNLDGSGNLTYSFPLPNLPVDADALVWRLQSLFLGTEGFVLGPASSLIVLRQGL